MRRGARFGACAAAALGALLASGCGEDASSSQASGVAERFVRATPVEACQLLAPATIEAVTAGGSGGCVQALSGHRRAGSPRVQRVEVAGGSAYVVLADQVVFLARFPQGWLVTAAGCSRNDPDPAVPYDCEVEP